MVLPKNNVMVQCKGCVLITHTAQKKHQEGLEVGGSTKLQEVVRPEEPEQEDRKSQHIRDVGLWYDKCLHLVVTRRRRTVGRTPTHKHCVIVRS
jgi:hypothetical protein